MKLKQSAIDEFLTEFKLECQRYDVELNIRSNHTLGSHYVPLKIVLDRSQIEAYIETSTADPLDRCSLLFRKAYD